MFFNIVVNNCDDCLVEYEFGSASDFLEALEDDGRPIPMLDDFLFTLDYEESDFMVNWNEQDLDDMGIATVDDLRTWMLGEDCRWLDGEPRHINGVLDKTGFRQWIYDNYNVPADNCTLAPKMLEGILDYAEKLDYDRQYDFLCEMFPSLPESVIRKVSY